MQNNISYKAPTRDEVLCVEPESKLFYNASEVSRLLFVSRSKAYYEIRKLNQESVQKDYAAISGKVPVKYFHERFYCT